jgi:hypothetical protein
MYDLSAKTNYEWDGLTSMTVTANFSKQSINV